MRDQQARRGLTTSPPPSPVAETPPPAYDLFAPPTYDSLCTGGGTSSEKGDFDVYVVPVHALNTLVNESERERQDGPPSYTITVSQPGQGR